MSRFCKLSLFITLFVLFANVNLQAENEKDDEKDDAKRLIQKRLDQIQNLTVSYALTKEYTPPPMDLENLEKRLGLTVMVVKTGEEESDNKYYFLHNKARYECYFKKIERAVEPGIPIKDHVFRIFAYPGDRVESLHLVEGEDHHQGARRRTMPLPFSTVEFGLGLRMWPENKWLSTVQIDKMRIMSSDGEQVLVSLVDFNNRTHEWRFDPKLGYALTSYRIQTPPPDKRLNIECVAQDFNEIENVWLPSIIKSSIYSWDNTNNKLWLGIQEIAEIEEYKLNDPNNTSERYYIKWPEGTYLVDAIANTSFKIIGGRAIPRSRSGLFPKNDP